MERYEKQFGISNRKEMSFLSNLWISHNHRLMNDIVKPEFISHFLKLEETYFSYFDEQHCENMRPFAAQQESEGFTCLVNGNLTYRLLSPIYR